ncbi:RLA class II histocompatibility antigen, DP alpha-1 chain-like [Channa argus]|uniref:RLA class II histocompatibility antigen, DP alpha-1 chain-like n=1 Tax=Channa argus TaxID=215402 RepID=UPI0035214B73
MKRSAFLILILTNISAFSQIAHEITLVVGCFHNGTAEMQVEFDAQEVLYVDFKRHELVYTVPKFLVLDPRTIFEGMGIYEAGKKGKNACSAVVAYYIDMEKDLREDRDPPESVLYPAEEIQPGFENSLVCFVNHFYPPYIKVSWTKNGHPVSQGVSLSQYYPNTDRTFHQFSTLTFTPSQGDIYSCTVEHIALERPKTRIWEIKFTHHNYGPDFLCGTGLALGLLGVATGTFLILKGHYRKTFPQL